MDVDSDGMGEFEDPYEDEYSSSEGEIVQEMDPEGEVDMGDDGEGEERVFLPGDKLGHDEVLEADTTAYVMLHTMGSKWPCLSFDMIQDGLGHDRVRFPHTMYYVTGTQADKPKNNEVMVMKVSQLHKTNDIESDDDDEDKQTEEDELDDDPILEHHSIKHYGGVNRIRMMQHDNARVVATWADTGKVHLFDIASQMHALENPGSVVNHSTQPLFTVNAHAGCEGFAMDWSSVAHGKLLTGDFNGRIYLTSTRENGFHTDDAAFTAHTSSVEDIQWSPVEKTVFASCSADQTIRIWDTRAKRSQSARDFRAHESDVNVMSWNRKVAYLLASGSDDGTFSVWDMRMLMTSNAAPTPVASFKWHTQPITSIEWHPHEDSVVALSGADDQLTLWDLSVEADPEEERVKTQQGTDVPPQLLFIHQGQHDIKELHWHPQIPGCMVSTSADGFNLFKTISA
jgi:ribosome assembly protein RRB1